MKKYDYEERNSELQKKLKSDIPFSSYVKKQSTKIYPNLSYFFAKDDN